MGSLSFHPWYLREGEEVFYVGEGKLAVCMQHEVDHLDGVLFIDHVEPGQLFSDKDNEPVDVFEIIRLSRSSKSLW